MIISRFVYNEKTYNSLISVIIPVYNVEKYLRRCIYSILTQTFTDFELLLVDDGSTDSSRAICDEYARKDSRVRVFHKENGGPSSTRNVGIDNSKGNFLFFCDSDDYLNSNHLQNYADHLDADIVFQGYRQFDSKSDATISIKQVECSYATGAVDCMDLFCRLFLIGNFRIYL